MRSRRAALLAAAAGNGMAAYVGSRQPPTSQQPSRDKVLWRFGLIADIQYCDCDDAVNFSGSEKRGYRGTLDQTRQAVHMWNGLDPPPLFVAQLGDLIDGQNAGKYGAGISFSEPQSRQAWERVTGVLANCRAPMYHAIGNHELYNFEWAELKRRLTVAPAGWRATADGAGDGPEAFSFTARPHEGWTVITLNSYEVSIMQDAELPGQREAVRLMLEYNPNDVLGTQGNVNFFAGLSGAKLRYVPFNGGVGARQLRWLRREVVAARERGDRIIVLSHCPAWAPASSERTMLFDGAEVMKVLHEDGCGRVVAFIAGHKHSGGYGVDEEGMHHVTVESPLTHVDCFGYVDVYADRLELRGNGELPSRSMPFPKLQPVPRTATPAAKL